MFLTEINIRFRKNERTIGDARDREFEGKA
jgi:hypothetical protein